MHSEEISFWLPKPKYDALRGALGAQGKSLESELQALTEQLYEQLIPADQRQDIENLIRQDRLLAERRSAELRRFSVFRITENGSTRCLECEHAFDFLQADNQTRRYMRREMDPQPDTFAEYFLRAGSLISEEKFDERVGERIEGSVNITGLCDIDLDSGLFHTARHLNGWATFSIKDVTTAAYYAYRKSYRSNDDMWRIFLDCLDGKEQISEQGPQTQTMG